MTQDAPGHQRQAGISEPRRHGPIDLYELLEISPRASQAVIQAAYRVLARNSHTDLNASAKAAHRIRELNAAYGVLSNPQDRACYDLECLRAGRYERLMHPDHSMQRAPVPGRTHGLAARTPVAQRRPVDQRSTKLNAAALLALLVVIALAAIVLVVVSVGIDSAPEYSSVFNPPTIEMARR